MNYENKHRIESLAKAACPNNKKVSVIFRSKENKLSDRPNAFIVTVGKKGYTSVRQSNYWAVDTVNSCKDYSDQELAQILNTRTTTATKQLSPTEESKPEPLLKQSEQ